MTPTIYDVQVTRCRTLQFYAFSFPRGNKYFCHVKRSIDKSKRTRYAEKLFEPRLAPAQHIA